MARERGRRIYLTLNTLLKPGELVDALSLLGEAVDRGIDAVIVQDVGLITLIRRVYPSLEIHGSTQLTVHDDTGARLVHGAWRAPRRDGAREHPRGPPRDPRSRCRNSSWSRSCTARSASRIRASASCRG